jgi:hypothetical protein
MISWCYRILFQYHMSIPGQLMCASEQKTTTNIHINRLLSIREKKKIYVQNMRHNVK